MQKIVILGATSGIAQATVRIMARSGKEVLLVGRSADRLQAAAADLRVRGAKNVLTCEADLAKISCHPAILSFAEQNFCGFDTVLLSYGSMHREDCRHSVELSLDEWQTNFVSAAALLTLFADAFESRRRGCLAVITSVAGDRGRRSNYVYGSAKGALSIFLQGLRSRLHSAGVSVITIKLGPVQTPMTAHMPHANRFADPRVVASAIYRAMENRTPDILYSPRYWRYIMAAVRMFPESVFKRLPL